MHDLRYLLPYGWDWNLAMAFGSILAATDPVAVVALLKAVGASPKLTMQITGEVFGIFLLLLSGILLERFFCKARILLLQQIIIIAGD